MKLTMFKIALACFALSGFLMAAAAQAHETQSNGFSLNGLVLAAASRQPLAGVRIEAFQPALGQHVFATERTTPTQTVTTGADGRFALNSLVPGPATVVFSKFGYQSVRYDVDLIGRSGPIDSGPILMWRPEFSAMPCGGLVQPGQTANVYIVCGSVR